MRDGAALNVTNYTWQFGAKYGVDDAATVFTLSSPGDFVLTSAASGVIQIIVPASATSSLPDYKVSLVYDLVGTDPNGAPYTFLRGKFIVDPGVLT